MSLVPRLPDDLVCMEILARLPWYARPVVASTCRSLKQAVEGMDPEHFRKADLEGQFVDFSRDGSMLLEDQECSWPWHRLPNFTAPDSLMWAAVTDGMVVVWSNTVLIGNRAVFKLELSEPVLKWEAIVNCPAIDSPTLLGAVVFRGHLYYSCMEKVDAMGDAMQFDQLRQCNLRTGQVLEHQIPEDVQRVWCAGDDRHLHALGARSGTILEFDTTTFQWKHVFNLKQAFPAGSLSSMCSKWPATGSLTECVLFDPNTRQWVGVTIEHPPAQKGFIGMLLASLRGSIYAIYTTELWKCRIDFKSKKNTPWKSICRRDDGGFRPMGLLSLAKASLILHPRERA